MARNQSAVPDSAGRTNDWVELFNPTGVEFDLTGMALTALDSPELQHLLVDAVVGPYNPYLEELKSQSEVRPNTRLHVQPANYIELLRRADICVGAGGTSTWERLFLGLPSIVVTVAKNQEAFIEELHKAKYLNWIGRSENMTSDQMRDSLIEMKTKIMDGKNRILMPDIVDGEGVERVMAAIMGY